MDLPQTLIDAATQYDRPATEDAARKLAEQARTTGEPLEERPLRKALTALRNNRWFDLLQWTGDRLIQSGDARPSIRKLYAQGLIDTGAISAAIPFLERLEREAGDNAYERDEARGLLGRAWKQAYVGGETFSAARGKQVIETAIGWYYAPYTENKANYYQGINAVACLARAERDGIQTSGDFPDWRELAKLLRDTIDDQENPPYWDYATAGEACVALKQWKEALAWYDRYVAHPETNAFAVASSLRQLTEVWQLSRTADDGSAAPLLLLEAILLRKKGGESLDATDTSARLQTLKGEQMTLEAVLGTERYKPLGWLETGLKRARAVGRIATENALVSGTGFLVSDPSLGDGQFLITNNHVIPTAIDANDAYVTFEALDGGKKKYPVAEQVWTSAISDLDATVLRLEQPVKNVEPYPICAALPALDPKPYVFIIGHPLGGRLAVSITDNLILDYLDPKLHYRAPTDPGSSGSPVFDAEWKLLALHHSGGKSVPKLHGGGKYEANEGMYFPTIVGEFKKKKKRATSRKRG